MFFINQSSADKRKWFTLLELERRNWKKEELSNLNRDISTYDTDWPWDKESEICQE